MLHYLPKDTKEALILDAKCFCGNVTNLNRLLTYKSRIYLFTCINPAIHFARETCERLTKFSQKNKIKLLMQMSFNV